MIAPARDDDEGFSIEYVTPAAGVELLPGETMAEWFDRQPHIKPTLLDLEPLWDRPPGETEN